MIARRRGGKIINISSQAGRRGEALVTVYCATKAAVISITQSCALELIKHGINVNAIAPGVIDTPMWDQVDALFAKYENRPIGEKKRLVGEAVPFGRMGVPEDITGAAVFLASSDADYIVAQTLQCRRRQLDELRRRIAPARTLGCLCDVVVEDRAFTAPQPAARRPDAGAATPCGAGSLDWPAVHAEEPRAGPCAIR